MTDQFAEMWEDVSFDPDPNSDLGYEMTRLSIIYVQDGGEKYIFLPGKEDHLLDNEYIVASPEGVCIPSDHR